MMDITLVIDDLDLSTKLSTYSFREEVSYRKVITTLDDVEHPYPARTRKVISFTLFPMNEVDNAALWSKLKKLILTVKCTDTQRRQTTTQQMRVVSDVESAFALRSVDGYRYYKGAAIELRATSPD